MKTTLNFLCLTTIVLTAYGASAASFDCAIAAAPIEKLICSSEKTSSLDQQLGGVYKKQFDLATDKEAMKLQQRTWLKESRNLCKTTDCLIGSYEARLKELNSKIEVVEAAGSGIAKKPNFKISDGDNLDLCQEYLKVLNRTPREDLRACKLPDLTGSPIQPVQFKPLVGDALKVMDKIVYEQNGGGPHLDWEQRWPEREKEYAQGYLRLAEAYWDLDKDGKPDQIIRESSPYARCNFLGKGSASDMQKELDKSWNLLSKEQQIASANENGLKNFYSLVRDGKLSFVIANNFVKFGDEYISIDQGDLRRMFTLSDWSNMDWVKIWGVNSKRDDASRSYDMAAAICSFTFIK